MNKSNISLSVLDYVSKRYIPALIISDKAGEVHFMSEAAQQLFQVSWQAGQILSLEGISEFLETKFDQWMGADLTPSDARVKVDFSFELFIHGEYYAANWSPIHARELAALPTAQPSLFQLNITLAPQRRAEPFSLDISEALYPICICSQRAILDANQHFCDLLGYPLAEIMGQDFKNWVYPDDVKRAYAMQKKMHRKESAGEVIELRLMKKNQTLLHVTIRTIVSFDSQGNFQKAVYSLQNITEEKEMEWMYGSLSRHIVGAYNDTFFQQLVEGIAESLNVRYAYIGKYIPEAQKLEIKAFYPDKAEENLSLFALEGTPAGRILHQAKPVTFAEGLSQEFPADDWLRSLEVEGYMGVPLQSSRGEVIGLMVILDTRPIHHPEVCLSMLQIYSIRVAAELERAESEQALRRNEERYRMLFESSADGIMIVDWRKGKAVECNKRMAELFQTERKKILEGNTLKFSPPFQADGRRSEEKMNMIRKNAHRRQRFEWQFVRPNQELFDAEVIISPFIHKGQEMSVYILRDISARKRQEKALMVSEALQRATLEALPDLTLRLNREGKVLGYYDPQEEGEPEGISVGTHFSGKSHLNDFFSPEITSKILACWPRPDQPNQVVSFKYHIHQDTRQRFFEVRINAINAQEAVAVVRDISSLIEAQTQLANKISELDEKNQELKKYIESNLQLENFAYIASHDLRQPLLTTFGFAKQMEKRYKDTLDDRGKTYLNYILRSSKDMNDLIEDLLVYSRVNSEVQESMPIEIGELMADVLMLLNEPILNEEATVEVRNIPSTIEGAKTKLNQLFQNLISNAIKFHRKGVRPQVIISGQKIQSGWQFSIKDNGIGIAEKDIDKIFLLFKRLHSKEVYRGTGIGLAICKKIVEQHGGKIWVESVLGEGSVFHFTIAPGEHISNLSY